MFMIQSGIKVQKNNFSKRSQTINKGGGTVSTGFSDVADFM
jgi:hypothetical protein